MTWMRFHSIFTTQLLLQIIVVLGATVALRAFAMFG